MVNSKTNNTIQAFWVAMGNLSSIALSIVSAAILSRYFDKAEYGTYKQIVYVYSTLLIVFSAGLPRVFAYFLPRFSLEEGKSIVNKVNRVLFLAGLVFSLFLFSFSGIIASVLKNPDLAYGLKVFSPIPMLLLPTLGIEGIFSTYKKTLFIAIYNTLSRVLMLIFIVVPVIIFKGNYISAIYGWLVVSVLTFIMAYFFKGIPFKNIESKETALNFKEIFSYSLPLVTASLWGIAIKSADQFFISRYFGNEIFAEFSNGFIELPFVSMVTASTSVVLMPMFSKMISDNTSKLELINLWKSALSKSAIIIYPIVIFCIFNAKNIMILLYSENYETSAIYFQINMFLNLFNIIVFAPFIFSMGETKFYSKLHMYLAFAVWLGDYLVVLTFNSPIALAIFSISLSILKVIIALKFISFKLDLSIKQLFPIKTSLKIVAHCGLFIILVLTISNYLFNNIYLPYKILLILILYIMLVLSTSKFFKIDYLKVYKPILDKINNYVAKI